MPNGFDTNDDSLHPNETLIVESQTCVGAQHFQEHTDAVFNWASGPSDWPLLSGLGFYFLICLCSKGSNSNSELWFSHFIITCGCVTSK